MVTTWTRTRSERRGATVVGCLSMVLVAAVVVYLATGIGAVYLRMYQLKDAMKQEIRFGKSLSDYEIRTHLSATADSLGLPQAATGIGLNRTGSHVRVWADYYEEVRFPFITRMVHLHPAAEGDF